MKEKMKILVAYDGSECADAALTDLKRAGLPRKAEAHVLSVCADWMPASASYGADQVNFTMFPRELKEHTLGMARSACAKLKSSFPEWEVHAEALIGAPANLILHRADELKSDLIVVGSHGRTAFGRLLLGSVSQKVLHAAHRTVRIARSQEKDPQTPIRLIMGIDGSKGAEGTIDVVARRHWPKGSEARIVNGFPVLPALGVEYADLALAQWISEEKERVEKAIEKASGRLKGAGLNVSAILTREDARRSLIDEAESWKADCIFVGARGMGAFERFLLGSVSSYVATHAPCSVEIIRE
jgi:nucleotide-binding universal stress UspA family protein